MLSKVLRASGRHLSSSFPQTLRRRSLLYPSYMAPKASSKRLRADGEASGTAATNGSAASDLTARGKQAAQQMLDFINYAWTPFHAVEEASRYRVKQARL